jgi:hypothetical protein
MYADCIYLDRVENSNTNIRALPPLTGFEEPTLGAIKRALHELSRAPASSAQGGTGANLREAHAFLRLLARRQGINPDDAVQRSRVAVESQRKRLVQVSAAASE